ncbi:MAG: insulinase family protein [Gomphosphaeria aponina SAG 52.96 = DSM 107014]|uniref:Insulinase family protein n=1 Tax=Gomphosphaeria aponina SAG 52.96 = DSM 107014 TaxID=1521640 RepID=A0A941GNA8_9CHRO|nr:insulinase family protein [Gomphosphaeria aponina SAG 52.96 = DSM 107014]
MLTKRLISFFFFFLLVWTSLARGAYSQPHPVYNLATSDMMLERVSSRITEFTLDNGLKFIVLENHQAPVISFVTYANVGGVNEPDGKTGVAHFLEHLAFKGTKQIGTTNYQAETLVLDSLDQVWKQIKAAQAAGKEEEVTKLQQTFKQLEAEAAEYVIQNEFGQIVESFGGVGLNAATSADATTYFYSFPSNKLELWMSLESERFLEPVFREFYKEQQVILEERRLRTDNSPIGQMIEAFLDTAFTQHPYKRPVIGYPEDIANLTRNDVQQFFDTYYGPSNLTLALVGDVNPTQVKQLAEVYFGRYQPLPSPQSVTTVEPVQTQRREVTLKLPSQPWYLEGYHRGGINDPDHAVYQIISAILSNGRTSRLYRSLVEEKQVALTAQGFSGFPGDKYPNLMIFYALTAPSQTVDDVAVALNLEIERLKTEPVSEAELERVKTQARAGLLRTLDSNMGMARLLAEYEAKTGSWRNLFTQLQAQSSVSAADVQRVSQSTFTPENLTIGRLLPSS